MKPLGLRVVVVLEMLGELPHSRGCVSSEQIDEGAMEYGWLYRSLVFENEVAAVVMDWMFDEDRFGEQRNRIRFRYLNYVNVFVLSQ
jgi:hypothetical protein